MRVSRDVFSSFVSYFSAYSWRVASSTRGWYAVHIQSCKSLTHRPGKHHETTTSFWAFFLKSPDTMQHSIELFHFVTMAFLEFIWPWPIMSNSPLCKCTEIQKHSMIWHEKAICTNCNVVVNNQGIHDLERALTLIGLWGNIDRLAWCSWAVGR